MVKGMRGSDEWWAHELSHSLQPRINKSVLLSSALCNVKERVLFRGAMKVARKKVIKEEVSYIKIIWIPQKCKCSAWNTNILITWFCLYHFRNWHKTVCCEMGRPINHFCEKINFIDILNVYVTFIVINIENKFFATVVQQIYWLRVACWRLKVFKILLEKVKKIIFDNYFCNKIRLEKMLKDLCSLWANL